jgi:hypothetical protein
MGTFGASESTFGASISRLINAGSGAGAIEGIQKLRATIAPGNFSEFECGHGGSSLSIPLISQSDPADVTHTLNGTETVHDGLDPRDCLAEIDRLVSSSVFLGSEALCRLLRYIAQHTLSTPAEHLKEYQIATEVLDRSADFDPQADSCVRVQMGRLRSKLEQYYDATGARDAILVSVPKGRYIVTFHRRNPVVERIAEPKREVNAKPAFGEVAEPSFRPNAKEPIASYPSSADAANLRRIVVVLAILVGLLVLAGATVLVIGHIHSAATGNESGVRQTPPATQMFWSPFLSGPKEPFVVFSNAYFVGTALNGMRYFDPSRDSTDQLQQHYTGIGEVMGVLALDRLFQQQFGRTFHIKRSGLFTLDDARDNNLIFVGSPTENLTLAKIPNTQEFIFRKLDSGPNRGEQVVVDAHPQAVGSGVFLPTPRGRPMTDDYAVIALMRGLDRSRWTLILAGASTVGTEAAVEYVSDDKSLQEILGRLKISNGSGMRPFEALLHVKIANDVPLETQLVSARQTNY